MGKIDIDNYEAFLLDYFEGNLNESDVAELRAFALTHPELEIDLAENDLPYFEANDVSIDFKGDLKKTEADHLNEEVLHYMEGLLSPEQKAAFEARLTTDKGLALSLSQYQKTILSADLNEVFDDHSLLLKTEDDAVVSNQVIAYMENQLPIGEKIEFEKVLASDKDLQKEYALVLKTKMIADPSVVYPNKNELKKQPKVIALFSYRSAAALAAAVLLVLLFVFVFSYYNKPATSTTIAKKSTDRSKASPQDAIANKNPLVPVAKNNSREISQEKNNAEYVKQQEQQQSEKQNESVDQQQQQIEQEEGLIVKQNENEIERKETKNSVIPEPDKQEGLASNVSDPPKKDSVVNKSNYVAEVAYGGDEDEFEKALQPNSNKGFWKRAVQVARQANKLGVKSVDGQENDGQKYRLSFNSFSVEKK